MAGQTSVKAPERQAFEKHLPEDVHIVSCHSLHGPTVSPVGQPLVRSIDSPVTDLYKQALLGDYQAQSTRLGIQPCGRHPSSVQVSICLFKLRRARFGNSQYPGCYSRSFLEVTFIIYDQYKLLTGFEKHGYGLAQFRLLSLGGRGPLCVGHRSSQSEHYATDLCK